jgi:hypothetical protein
MVAHYLRSDRKDPSRLLPMEMTDVEQMEVVVVWSLFDQALACG